MRRGYSSSTAADQLRPPPPGPAPGGQPPDDDHGCANCQPARLTDWQPPDGYKLDVAATARALDVMRAEACPGLCDECDLLGYRSCDCYDPDVHDNPRSDPR